MLIKSVYPYEKLISEATLTSKVTDFVWPEYKSPKINIHESDLQSINNLLKRINKDYQGRPIRIFVPKYFVPKKIEIKSTEINRNLLIDLTGSKFLHDLIID